MRATITLAAPDDDASIRALLARNPVPGRISLTYRREPDYFAGCDAMGSFHQVLVAKEEDEVVGLACRAIRPMFINGLPQPVGYLGQLRVDAPHRGRWFVSRGFRLLRQLHADGRTTGYVTTIIEKNREAMGVLVARPRSGMPRYRQVDTLHTLALCARNRSRRLGGLEAGPATPDELGDVVAFLNRAGAQRQFFPVISAGDVSTPALRDLAATDFFMARHHGAIRAACALWDQSSFKQTMVSSYSGVLGNARPVYNLAARILRRPALPAIGAAVPVIYASFLCTADDDPDALAALLEAVLAAAAARGASYVIAGLSGGDPLLPTAQRLPHVEYRSDIYTVTWSDGGEFHDRLDGRPAYLDPALL